MVETERRISAQEMEAAHCKTATGKVANAEGALAGEIVVIFKVLQRELQNDLQNNRKEVNCQTICQKLASFIARGILGQNASSEAMKNFPNIIT